MSVLHAVGEVMESHILLGLLLIVYGAMDHRSKED